MRKLSAISAFLILLSAPAFARDLAPLGAMPPKGLNIVDWKQIRAEYERHRHGAFPSTSVPGGLQARSFEQQWLAQFDGRGSTVAPDEGAWRWGLELAGVGGKGAKVSRMSIGLHIVGMRIWTNGI